MCKVLGLQQYIDASLYRDIWLRYNTHDTGTLYRDTHDTHIYTCMTLYYVNGEQLVCKLYTFWIHPFSV